MANVKAIVDLHALVCTINDKSDPQSRLGRENREEQRVDKHRCIADDIDYNEWRWRWEKAIDILCAGYVETTGYYLGDAVGGLFV